MPARMIGATIATLIVASPACAALTLDPPMPIEHQVRVRIIETALDDGSEVATVFGNDAQRADIEANVDSIWAQAGIDVEFLDPIIRYDDTFAYQGSQEAGEIRPASDLNAMLAGAGFAGDILHSDSSVINMFFVNIVPSFAFTSEWTANGRAQIGSNGIAQFVGENLLNTLDNRDIASKIVAHEIGHNLGLRHTGIATNLMETTGGISAQELTEDQIEAVFQTTYRSDTIASIPVGGTGFVESLSILPGDYNSDGTIDQADYIVWRDTLGSTTDLTADGNSNGLVDHIDYLYWKANWGLSSGSGSSASGFATAVPEPISGWLALIATLLVAGSRAVDRRLRIPH